MKERVERIALAGQLAIVLEVSAYPKPGNISRLHPFQDTSLDHFLAGGVAVGPTLRRAALRGFRIGSGRVSPERAGLGLCLEEAVKASRRWHSGGNTNFGTLLLLIPMAAAAGLLEAEGGSLQRLGREVKRLVEHSTVEDAQALYRAIRLAGVGGLGEPPKGFPDVLSTSALRELKRKRLTLHQVLKACSPFDSLCRELVEGLPVTLKVGYPILLETYRQTGDINKAIVQAFLNLLASQPDTLIARKAGIKKAEEVSKQAKHVLELGGVLTKKGLRRAELLDRRLKACDGRLNPGATADLTAASLMRFLLAGFKP